MDRKHNLKNVPVARMLRKNMTKEEKHLWYDFLRFCPGKFSRQKVIGKYIVDFYSAQTRLVIELDGSQHGTKKGKEADAERTAYLNQYGLRIIRIPNFEIQLNFQNICQYLLDLIERSLMK